MENFKSIQKFLYLRETLEKYLSSSPMVLVAAYRVPKKHTMNAHYDSSKQLQSLSDWNSCYLN
jgi:hypothetical protein